MTAAVYRRRQGVASGCYRTVNTMSAHRAVVAGGPLDSGTRSYVMGKNRDDATIEGPERADRETAFIGDEAYCSACNSVGVIIGGVNVREDQRLDFADEGRPQAVGGIWSPANVLFIPGSPPPPTGETGNQVTFLAASRSRPMNTDAAVSTSIDSHWIKFRLDKPGT
jgi:hypothetical protein